MASNRITISEDVTDVAPGNIGGHESDIPEETDFSDEEDEDVYHDDDSEAEYPQYIDEEEYDEYQDLRSARDFDTKKRSRNPSLDDLTKSVDSGKRPNIKLFPDPEPDGREHRVLHRVVCRASAHHIFKLFEDVPIRGSVGHLSGFEHLRHEQDFATKYPNLAFIVIKEHYCKPEDAKSSSYDTAGAGYSRSSQHYSDNGCIRIIDKELKSTMSRIATAYIYGSGNEDICPPYLWLYHHRSDLRTEQSSAKGIKSLLDYANCKYGDLYARADRHLRAGIVDKETLPFLFSPSSLVVSRVTPKRTYDRAPVLKAYVLQDWPTFSGDHVHLTGWHYKHNSARATRAARSTALRIPLWQSDINKMSNFPFKYANDTQKSTLVNRGREYWTFKTARNVCYDGWDDQENLLLSDARLMVDYRTYRQLHPRSTYWNEDVIVREADCWSIDLDHDQSLTDKEFAMFPETLHAFLLKEKKWITIQVERTYPIEWNSQAFERLVLPENTKDLIKSLVLVRTTEIGASKGLSLAGRRKDIIAGKGNGLIMLLHGAPGTGKTLTAESVAEIAKRPLYNVTCGDIGTNPEAVEKYLKDVLFLGKTWNCILLLDEADVFLEERSLSDLSRNSLVSVFLRTLEYYDGILILTSNRVGTFDEAFNSRIQVSLHFPLLDPLSRRKIWKNFLDMLQEDKEEVDYVGLSSRLDQLSNIDMNGRQIRNVLTTARQLAMYKMVTLEWDHVQRALKSVADFKSYMQSVHGHTDEQNARDEKLR